MSSSLHTREYRIFLTVLKAAREESGVTQVELAAALKQTQGYVSKFERGERRLDIVQIRAICRALDIPLTELIQRYESALAKR